MTGVFGLDQLSVAGSLVNYYSSVGKSFFMKQAWIRAKVSGLDSHSFHGFSYPCHEALVRFNALRRERIEFCAGLSVCRSTNPWEIIHSETGPSF